MLRAGAVLSMLIEATVALALLSALSVQVPVADWLAPSVRVVAAGGLPAARPLRLSAQLKLTATSALYQPLALGARSGLPLIVGAVASRLIVTDWPLVPPLLVAVQVKVVPAVSVVMLVGPQPFCDVTDDSGSTTVQLTATLLVYQPLFPNVPTMCGVMTGALVSVGVGVLVGGAGVLVGGTGVLVGGTGVLVGVAVGAV